MAARLSGPTIPKAWTRPSTSSKASSTARIPIPAPRAPTPSSIVTEWDAFRALDLERIRDALKQPILVDLRNIYRADDLAEHGFTYVSVGRPELRPEARDAAVDLATRKRAAS